MFVVHGPDGDSSANGGHRLVDPSAVLCSAPHSAPRLDAHELRSLANVIATHLLHSLSRRVVIDDTIGDEHDISRRLFCLKLVLHAATWDEAGLRPMNVGEEGYGVSSIVSQRLLRNVERLVSRWNAFPVDDWVNRQAATASIQFQSNTLDLRGGLNVSSSRILDLPLLDVDAREAVSSRAMETAATAAKAGIGEGTVRSRRGDDCVTVLLPCDVCDLTASLVRRSNPRVDCSSPSLSSIEGMVVGRIAQMTAQRCGATDFWLLDPVNLCVVLNDLCSLATHPVDVHLRRTFHLMLQSRTQLQCELCAEAIVRLHPHEPPTPRSHCLVLNFPKRVVARKKHLLPLVEHAVMLADALMYRVESTPIVDTTAMSTASALLGPLPRAASDDGPDAVLSLSRRSVDEDWGLRFFDDTLLLQAIRGDSPAADACRRAIEGKQLSLQGLARGKSWSYTSETPLSPSSSQPIEVSNSSGGGDVPVLAVAKLDFCTVSSQMQVREALGDMLSATLHLQTAVDGAPPAPAPTPSPLLSPLYAARWEKKFASEKWGLQLHEGTIIVANLQPNTPASRVPPPLGSMIVSINGVETTTLAEVTAQMREKQAVEVVLAAPCKVVVKKADAKEPLGIGLPPDAVKPPIVQRIVENSPAARAALTSGARITHIGATYVANVQATIAALKDAAPSAVETGIEISFITAVRDAASPIRLASVAVVSEETTPAAKPIPPVVPKLEAVTLLTVDRGENSEVPLGVNVNIQTGEILSVKPTGAVAVALQQLKVKGSIPTDDPSCVVGMFLSHIDKVRLTPHEPLGTVLKTKGRNFTIQLDPEQPKHSVEVPIREAKTNTAEMLEVPTIEWILKEALKGMSRPARLSAESKIPGWVKTLKTEEHIYNTRDIRSNTAETLLRRGIPSNIVENIFPFGIADVHCMGYASRRMLSLECGLAMGFGIPVVVDEALKDAAGAEAIAPAQIAMITSIDTIAPFLEQAKPAESTATQTEGAVAAPAFPSIRCKNNDFCVDPRVNNESSPAPSVFVSDELGVALIVPVDQTRCRPVKGSWGGKKDDVGLYAYCPQGGRIKFDVSSVPPTNGTFEIDVECRSHVPPFLLPGTPLFHQSRLSHVVLRSHYDAAQGKMGVKAVELAALAKSTLRRCVVAMK